MDNTTFTPHEALAKVQSLLDNEDTSLESLREVFQSVGSKISENARSTTAPSGGQEVVPEKGFVVKTTDDAGSKVFINICSSDKVAIPGDWPNCQVPLNILDKLEKSDNADYIRLPLSLGKPRADFDHSSKPCLTVDCIFNTSVVHQAERHRKLKLHVIKLTLGWIQEKLQIQLNASFKLPKMRYKGTLAPQIVRVDRRPVVEEVGYIPEAPSIHLGFGEKQETGCSSAGSKPGQGPRNCVSPSNPAQDSRRAGAKPGGSAFNFSGASGRLQEKGGGEPAASVAERPSLTSELYFEGRPVEAVQITISGSLDLRLEELGIELQGDTVFVASKLHQLLVIRMPFGVDPKRAEVLPGEHRKLRLKLPYLPLKKWLAPDPVIWAH